MLVYQRPTAVRRSANDRQQSALWPLGERLTAVKQLSYA